MNSIEKKNDYYKNLKTNKEYDYYKLCPEYNYIPTQLPAVNRIVVFGDIHGDYELAKALLIFSKVANFDINNNPTWIGRDTHVVQVGDQIDRARPLFKNDDDEHSDINIMELFNNLHKQAIKYNGAVISLLGNHELMNSMGIMDYVSSKGISEFKNEELDITDENYSGLKARIHAFKPGNKIGKMMGCTRLASVIIGSNLFVHGGIIDNMVDTLNIKNRDSLEAFNILVSKWLLGTIKRQQIDKYISEGSPFWARVLGKLPPGTKYTSDICFNNLSKTMKVLQINRMIIGHTPQSEINSTCDDKIWRVDTGLSKAFTPIHKFYGNKVNPISYLEILDDTKFEVKTFMEQV